MSTIEHFEDLEVWKRVRELTNIVYDLSKTGDFARDFGLRDQIRRAAVSAMSDIAEGFESRTQALFIDYLGRAKGSTGELRSQLYLALDRNYISQENFNRASSLARTCSKQLSAFIHYLETQPNSRRLREGEVSYEV